MSGQLLGKIPRSVRVVAKGDSSIKGKPLQRHHAKKGRERLTRLWNIVDATLITTAELSEEVAAFAVLAVRDDDGEEVHLTILHLLHCRNLDALVLWSRVEDDENRRQAWVDFRVGKQVVGNTRCGEALAVQVGQFFHFQTAFLSDSFC